MLSSISAFPQLTNLTAAGLVDLDLLMIGSSRGKMWEALESNEEHIECKKILVDFCK
jgi:hypothetical protein